MEFSTSSPVFDIFQIYRRYCDIKSGKSYPNALMDDSEKVNFSREAMTQLAKIVDFTFSMRVLVLDELQKLMACQNTMGDFSEFSTFYDFVFFMCRENNQKNITVGRAIAAWRLALAGRFRLLNQWCHFVEENHQYNISEDTWRQVLAFSRCVHEDLEGYDPEGAWPSLIDDFVEHMYRITGSNACDSHNLTCQCGDPDGQSSIFEEPLPGLKELPGFKRKYRDNLQGTGLANDVSMPSDLINSLANFKRRKQLQQLRDGDSFSNASSEELATLKLNSPLQTLKPACAVEGCLSKGFSGLFSSPRVKN